MYWLRYLALARADRFSPHSGRDSARISFSVDLSYMYKNTVCSVACANTVSYRGRGTLQRETSAPSNDPSSSFHPHRHRGRPRFSPRITLSLHTRGTTARSQGHRTAAAVRRSTCMAFDLYGVRRVWVFIRAKKSLAEPGPTNAGAAPACN